MTNHMIMLGLHLIQYVTGHKFLIRSMTMGVVMIIMMMMMMMMMSMHMFITLNSSTLNTVANTDRKVRSSRMVQHHNVQLFC